VAGFVDAVFVDAVFVVAVFVVAVFVVAVFVVAVLVVVDVLVSAGAAAGVVAAELVACLVPPQPASASAPNNPSASVRRLMAASLFSPPAIGRKSASAPRSRRPDGSAPARGRAPPRRA
jgi:hypothetical protein